MSVFQQVDKNYTFGMLGLKQSRYSLFFSFVIQNVLINSYFTVEVSIQATVR